MGPAHHPHPRAALADMSFRPRPTVLFQEVSEGAVLFSTSDEVYFGLNATAALVWRALMAQPRDVPELARLMATSYPEVPVSELEAHAAELVSDFVANGLLEAVTAEHEPAVAAVAHAR